jgi:hypothetical protein
MYSTRNGNTVRALPSLNSAPISLRLFSRSFLPSVFDGSMITVAVIKQN